MSGGHKVVIVYPRPRALGPRCHEKVYILQVVACQDTVFWGKTLIMKLTWANAGQVRT